VRRKRASRVRIATRECYTAWVTAKENVPTHVPSTESVTNRPVSLLASHAVLIGLTPLVPVPFVDDYLADRLRRSMVERLASKQGVALPTESVRGLADQPTQTLASLGGVAKKVLLWPAKKIFRKVFVVLAVKDGVDLVGRAFVLGYLVDVSLERGFTNRHHPKALRLGIDAVSKRVGTSPVNQAVGHAFARAKTALPDLADRLRGQAKKAGAATANEQAAGEVGDAFAAEVRAVSPGYFDRLVKELCKELGEDEVHPTGR
jgi:uncharacterized protein (DUF697 family)